MPADLWDSLPTDATVDAAAARYRILGPVGIGGMGVVYRAEDTLLGRLVALKFLAPQLTPNPRAKARFLAEARAASALDHPNICTIYEVGETSEGQLFLAMACYDGETLKRRLERGPLAPAEALSIALQVARGLAKAHGRGIVHRDVKPANLMITADGIVKILDFGIAKWPEQAAAGPLLGTPGYMSPEQARGEEVDARSDVWSLGAVLHEMLTGERPGRSGPGAARREPGSALPAGKDLPPSLAGVLERLLAPDPAQRYADAGAALPDLAALERVAAGERPMRARGFSWRRRPRLWLGAAVFGAALAVAFGPWLARALRRPDTAPAALRPAALTRLTDLPGREWFPSLSPDGASFLYAKKDRDRSRLFLQRTGGGRPLDLLPGPQEDDTQPAFSPDGQQIAFRSERDGGGIFLMEATGESVRRLTDSGFHPAWSPDGRQIVYATEGIVNPRIRRHPSDLFRIDLATGHRWRIDLASGRGRPVGRGDAVQPSWSPNGFRIAYWGISDAGQRVIWTVPAGGGEPRRVTDDHSIDWNPVWSPDGRSLYFASDRSGVMNLWRVPIDERSGRVLGAAQPLTTSSQAAMLLSVARDGRRIAFASDDPRSTLERIAFDPLSGTTRGAARAITWTPQVVLALDASRDGRWLVFKTSVPQESLFVVRPDGSGLRRLTHDGYKNSNPRLSPDGRRVAFYSNRSGKYEAWIIGTDGSGLEQVTAVPGRKVYHPIWSPDGTRLAVDAQQNEALVELTRPLPDRRAAPLPSPGPGLGFAASSWSPDGRLLAGILHRVDGPRLPGIVVYSLAERRYRRVTDRGESPCWLSDSKRLLYLSEERLTLLDARSGRTHLVLAPPAGSTYDDMVLSPDDRILYLLRFTYEGDIWLLKLP